MNTNLSVFIHLDRLRRNFRRLALPGRTLIPVVKADAYGHGLIQAGRALAEAGADTFGVSTVQEGVVLREAGCTGRIIAMLGAVTPEDFAGAWRHAITPLVYLPEHFSALAAARPRGEEKPLGIALKFNTGMGRLGFRPENAAEIVRLLADHPCLSPSFVVSHLASADEGCDNGAADYTHEQARRFLLAVKTLRDAGHEFQTSLANSAGHLAYPELRYDAQRPGLAVYGANPLCGTPSEHLGEENEPVMEARTTVLQVHDLAPGQCVSYGRTYTADRPTRVAVVGCGYADGYPRSLSYDGADIPPEDRPVMTVHGRRAPIIGRVCMQMTCLDVTDIDCETPVRPGDAAWLFGGDGDAVRIEELARWAGTIPYEILCLMGGNPRQWLDGDR